MPIISRPESCLIASHTRAYVSSSLCAQIHKVYTRCSSQVTSSSSPLELLKIPRERGRLGEREGERERESFKLFRYTIILYLKKRLSGNPLSTFHARKYVFVFPSTSSFRARNDRPRTRPHLSISLSLSNPLVGSERTRVIIQ